VDQDISMCAKLQDIINLEMHTMVSKNNLRLSYEYYMTASDKPALIIKSVLFLAASFSLCYFSKFPQYHAK